ncbi:phage major capsid protein [Methylovirgula sp. 4M-Z18]|uniref:phage major capsid protein n=1 Tax=Methylovirgula sp. 4M-Z18 TaxID=2293567 RepID=UPI000E2E68EE|nr:phage major capsid protein [Methylovirgula sp. 4M-Z18]RFB80409.1 phage major capsid protein [Methylovirgula sp. 4M-Z18]
MPKTVETQAPAASAEGANPAAGSPASHERAISIFVRRSNDAGLIPSSVNEAERTTDLVISTGAPVARSDWDDDYIETLSMDPQNIRVDRLNRGAPLLDAHDRYSGTRAVLGAIVPGSARVEGGQLVGTAKFSRSVDGDRAFQDVKDGVLRHVSVGYLTHKFEVDNSTTPPTHRATDWEPHEVSIVPIPADPQAGFRAADHNRAAPPSSKESTMPNVTPGAQPGQENRGTDVVVDQRDVDAAVAAATRRADQALDERVNAALEAEQTRRDAIENTVRSLGLPAEFATTHIRNKTSLNDFRALAIEEAAKFQRAAPTDGHNPHASPFVARGGIARDPEPGERAARFVRTIAAAPRLKMSPMDVARHWKDEMTARALSASIGASGGFMIPQDMANEVIDLLRPRSVVRSAGPRIVDMPTGNITFPRLNSGAVAGYVGENAPAPNGDEAFGQVRMTARKLMARVPISNDLLRFASPNADALVRDDMVKSLAIAEDRAFLRGAGTAFTPKGLRNLALPGNIFASVAVYSDATSLADMTKLVTALESNNVLMTKPVWFFSGRTKNYFYDLRDQVGGFLYRAEMDRGMFRGFPYKWTQSIPQNLVDGTQSEVMLVDMDEFMIGEVPGLMIDASTEATYTPDGTTLVSAFDNDQTVIRIIEEHDCALRHDAAAAVLTGVKWGT